MATAGSSKQAQDHGKGKRSSKEKSQDNSKDSQTGSPDPPPPQDGPPAKRKIKSGPRTSRACLSCRKQKMKCDGADDPPCRRCRALDLDCSFERRTDYMLNPEDLAWQNRIETRLDAIVSTVNAILAYSQGAGPLPPPILGTMVAPLMAPGVLDFQPLPGGDAFALSAFAELPGSGAMLQPQALPAADFNNPPQRRLRSSSNPLPDVPARQPRLARSRSMIELQPPESIPAPAPAPSMPPEIPAAPVVEIPDFTRFGQPSGSKEYDSQWLPDPAVASAESAWAGPSRRQGRPRRSQGSAAAAGANSAERTVPPRRAAAKSQSRDAGLNGIGSKVTPTRASKRLQTSMAEGSIAAEALMAVSGHVDFATSQPATDNGLADSSSTHTNGGARASTSKRKLTDAEMEGGEAEVEQVRSKRPRESAAS